MPEPSAFEIDKAIEKGKGSNQVLIKFQQNSAKQELEQFVLEAISLLIHFEQRRSCLRRGRSRSMYLSIRRAIKQIVVIIEACHV